MGERMTSRRAMNSSLTAYYGVPSHEANTKLRSDLTKAADALLAWEEEAEARAGMPELRCPWRVVDREGEEWRQGYTKEVMLREDHLTKLAASYPKDAPFRLVRLAVVEVAEPEPEPEPEPVREVGHSGWVYEVKRRDGVTYLEQHRDASGEPWTEVSHHGSRHEVPPADRALVARLLGEVG